MCIFMNDTTNGSFTFEESQSSSPKRRQSLLFMNLVARESTLQLSMLLYAIFEPCAYRGLVSYSFATDEYPCVQNFSIIFLNSLLHICSIIAQAHSLL